MGYDESSEELVLVDEADVQVGTHGKLDAHRSGLLHRAFSVFVFASDGRLLLQKRAPVKYHSAGKWTNTCCGHPRPGEDVLIAGQRRLAEETGINCELQRGFTARYRATLDNGMIENEIVHLLFGTSDAPGWCNPQEISAFRYVTLNELTVDLKRAPNQYSVWLNAYFLDHQPAIAAAGRQFLRS